MKTLEYCGFIQIGITADGRISAPPSGERGEVVCTWTPYGYVPDDLVWLRDTDIAEYLDANDCVEGSWRA